MSQQQLQQLQQANAFRPSPRLDQLADLHVPFDLLTRTTTCEDALDRALRQGHRVALVGASGTGKSSVVEHVLGPLVEGLAPMRVPVSMEHPNVATDPVEFSRHLTRLMRHWIQSALPARAGQARQLEQRPAGKRTQKFSVAPAWMEAKVELAYELSQASNDEPTSSTEIIEQARQLMELISYDEMTPVVVLDDTDRWLATSWQPDGPEVRAAFFGRVVRILAEDLGTAAVVAVHPTYLADPDYQAAGGFLDTTIQLPQVPDTSAALSILQRRAACALGEPVAAEDVIDPAAAGVIFTRYAQTPNVRKHLILIANAALTMAVDDGGSTITQAHAVAALDQENAEGP